MEDAHSNDIDVIVVGSGPGGATVARELSLKRKKVLIVERGDHKPYTGKAPYSAMDLLFPGKSLLITPQLLGVVRGITTGGSTIFYYAACFPVPVGTFKAYGIDLSQEVEDLRRELPIAPLKDEMIGPMAKRIMDAALDLGYGWRKIDKFMYQDRWRPEYSFSHYGDPYNVKWSARMYVEEALQNGARLVENARVVRVIFESGKAVGVVYRKNGATQKVFAPRIVISAGGIGSPVILRASGMKEAGYDFFFDPLIGVRGIVKDSDVPLSEIPMSCGVHLEDEGYIMTDMSHPSAVSAFVAAASLRPGQIFSRRNTLQIMVKVRDELGGRLTDRGGIRKMLGQSEKHKLKNGCERARKILKKAGARDIFRTNLLAAHPGGTVKVGHLLDSNLKTEYDNLYVCDCSVIPVSWGLPPTSTIIALGKRLAKHLSQELA